MSRKLGFRMFLSEVPTHSCSSFTSLTNNFLMAKFFPMFANYMNIHEVE